MPKEVWHLCHLEFSILNSASIESSKKKMTCNGFCNNGKQQMYPSKTNYTRVKLIVYVSTRNLLSPVNGP